MGLNADVRSDMADAATPRLVAVSLHDAAPGTDGSSEFSGGDYARLQAQWGTATDGQVDTTTGLVFGAPASLPATVAYMGVWDETGTWVGGEPVSPQATLSDPTSTYNLNRYRLNVVNQGA